MTETGSAAPPRARPAGLMAQAAAGLMAASCILWAVDAHRIWFGLTFYPEQLLVVVLGLTLFISYLTMPARRNSGNPPAWYDYLCAAVGLLVMLWTAAHWERLLYDIGYRTAEVLAISIVTVLLTLEALRRATGYTLLLVVLVFVVYAFVGDLVPGRMKALTIGPADLFIYLGFNPSSIFGTPLKIGAEVVVAYIFFGALLFKSGGGDFFTDLAMAVMGRRRGGAAKVAVVASGLFGTISGSAVSNVVSTGVITIPLMRKTGYSAVNAGAIEAVASTGGQMMPPVMGAAAFLMAEFLQIAYAEVVIAAVVPALLYYFAVFVQVDLIAGKEKIAVAGQQLPRVLAVFKEGWHFVIPFAVLLYALFALYAEAQTAAIYASVAIVALGAVRRYKGQRLTPRSLALAVVETGINTVELVLILAAAGCVIGILNQTGLGFALTLVLVELARNSVILLLVIAAVTCIILGMGMPTSGVYVLLAALVAPGIVQAGIQPLGAHMFILYFGMMSMLTPPVALAAYAAAALTGASAMQTGFESVKLGWVAFVVPFLFVFSPALFLMGSPLTVAVAIATAAIGVYLISAAVVGFFTRPLGPAYRALLAVAGLAAMTPASLMPLGHIVDAAGVVGGALLLAREYLAVRRLKTAAAE